MNCNDLPSLHGIKPPLWGPSKAEINLIPCFFSQEAVVLYSQNDGFIGKKRRF